MDISWISNEAKHLHDFFVSIFFTVASLLMVTGVLVEYFKVPLGNMPAFSQLVGRALVATILLIAYPEISNTVCNIADSIAEKLGDINTLSNVLASAGAAIKEFSWSWTSVGDSLLSVISILAYGILYITVYFFNAGIVYCLVLLFIFSPLMIAFFILPQTAGLTGGLFRTLFEVATWKIVWTVLGTLLWSTTLANFQNASENNFVTLLTLTLMLTFSIILTPIVTKQLISGGLSNIATQTASLAGMAMTAGVLSPGVLAAKGATLSKNAYVSSAKFGFKQAKKGYNNGRKFVSSLREPPPDNVIPFPKPPKK